MDRVVLVTVLKHPRIYAKYHLNAYTLKHETQDHRVLLEICIPLIGKSFHFENETVLNKQRTHTHQYFTLQRLKLRQIKVALVYRVCSKWNSKCWLKIHIFLWTQCLLLVAYFSLYVADLCFRLGMSDSRNCQRTGLFAFKLPPCPLPAWETTTVTQPFGDTCLRFVQCREDWCLIARVSGESKWEHFS